MAGFPQIPEIRGDTDDDASIHLFSRIGPSKPLARQKYDHQIMDILHGESSDTQANFDAQTYNEKFERYAKHLDDDSDTHVEEDVKRRPRSVKKKPNHVKVQLPAVLMLLGFLAGLYFTFASGVKTHDPDLASLRKRMTVYEKQIESLTAWSSGVDAQIDSIENKQNKLIEGYKSDLDSLGLQLEDVRSTLSAGASHYDALQRDIRECRESLGTLENLSKDPAVLQQRISEISSQLSRLSKINADIVKSKNDIIASFVESLPQHIPVYMKNGQIHYLPEFQRFLLQFMEKFDKGESFGKNEATEYIQNLIKQFADRVDLLPRSEFEKLLSSRLSIHESEMKQKFNTLLEKIDISGNLTHIDLAQASNKIVLDGLVDLVSKSSVKINFADYKLGARILGFLTSAGRAEASSIARKVFLGWYDYFASSRIAAANLRFNANAVLVDGAKYWQCGSAHCSLGIRLPEPVILTDLVFVNPSIGRPQGLALPTTISIYVKPKRKHQATLIEEYAKNFDFQEKPLANKYASKFLKVQEVNWVNPSSVEHIKLPVSLINMKILVRDIYIEIKLSEGNTGLFNLKAYGLTEFNSLRLSEGFDSMLDVLQKEEEFNRNLIFFDDDESS